MTAADEVRRRNRPSRLLVVEPEDGAPERSVRAVLAQEPDYECEPVSCNNLARAALGRTGVKGVIVVGSSLSESTTPFEWLRQNPLSVPVLAILREDASPSLLSLASENSDDFLLFPIRGWELRRRIDRLLHTRQADLDAVRERLLEDFGLTQILGSEPAFRRAIAHLPRFARSDMPVLITGETGTGKEICARTLHHLGPRRSSPFVAVDCGALPDQLFESEVFGHARGAFTDAYRDHRGLVSMAEGGTLLLDEIDSLSATAQGKLLRFLQERTFRPLGADRLLHANVNVIAASNMNLEQCVREKRFRSDLFFRLNVLRVELPPLRERAGDVQLLALHFLNQNRAAGTQPELSFAPAALRALELYDWPGNVRELANVIQRAVVICDGEQILPRHLAVPRTGVASHGPPLHFRAARADAVAAFEERYIKQLLRLHGGNITRAAREARKERRAFGRLVKKHNIDPRNL